MNYVCLNKVLFLFIYFLNKVLDHHNLFPDVFVLPETMQFFPQVFRWIDRSHAHESTLARSYPLNNF